MAVNYTRIEYLFELYFEGFASEAEEAELMKYISQAKNDQDTRQLIKQAWDKLDLEDSEFEFNEGGATIIKKILDEELASKSSRTLNSRKWYLVAAAAMFILGLSMLGYFSKKEEQTISKANEFASNLDYELYDKPSLVLTDGNIIQLDTLKQNVELSLKNSNIYKVSTEMLEFHGKSNSTEGFNTLITPKGGQYQITLEDGTNVFLNAFSQLKFPNTFSKTERVVYLSGEAYFDVKKDAKKPFKVIFEDAHVEVLGTSFNIKAYKEDDISRTTLIEGSVEVVNKLNTKRIVPGQQITINAKGGFTTKLVDVDIVTAWKNGFFHFKDSKVVEVMQTLSRWYNVKIDYPSKPILDEFNGKVSRTAKLSELIEMLNYAGIKCKLQGDVIKIIP